MLAVEERREHPACTRVREIDSLALVELVRDGAVELDDKVPRQDRVFAQIEGFLEIEVRRVHGIPEMVVRGGDDLIERPRPRGIAIDLDHRLKVRRSDRVVDGIVLDGVAHLRGSLREGAPQRVRGARGESGTAAPG